MSVPVDQCRSVSRRHSAPYSFPQWQHVRVSEYAVHAEQSAGSVRAVYRHDARPPVHTHRMGTHQCPAPHAGAPAREIRCLLETKGFPISIGNQRVSNKHLISHAGALPLGLPREPQHAIFRQSSPAARLWLHAQRSSTRHLCYYTQRHLCYYT